MSQTEAMTSQSQSAGNLSERSAFRTNSVRIPLRGTASHQTPAPTKPHRAHVVQSYFIV